MTKSKRKGTPYTPAPVLPAQLEERFIEVIGVLAGGKTVSQAARDLGISRVQFQTLMHRAIAGAIEGLAPRPSGKKPMSETERELRKEIEQLRAELEIQQMKMSAMASFAESVSAHLRGGKSPFVRQRKSSSSSTSKRTAKTSVTRTGPPASDPEPDPAEAIRHEQLAHARALGASKLGAERAARWAGLSASTVRRWSARAARGELLRRTTGPRAGQRRSPADARAHVRELVRASGGAIGAASLARSAGTSRREAARLKRAELTALERERLTACERIEVTAPGVVRGFDAMHVVLAEGRAYVLAAADGAVPYRTSLELALRYDEASVLAALERDLDEHGAPLVWRMDRASCQRTDAVRALLVARGVLLLHGPPRHPRYYGQLERQNREHRAVLAALERSPRRAFEARLLEARFVLNELYRRPTLAWQTAAERWRARPIVRADRLELREQVDHTRDRILCHMHDRSSAATELAERIAIERTLERRGLLRRRTGAKC